ATTTGKRSAGPAHEGTTTTARPGPHGCMPRSHWSRRTLAETGSGAGGPPANTSVREHANAVATPVVTPSTTARRPSKVTMSVVARCGGGLGRSRSERLAGRRMQQLDERRIAGHSLAQGAPDGFELARRQGSEMGGGLVDLQVDVTAHIDRPGTKALEGARPGCLGRLDPRGADSRGRRRREPEWVGRPGRYGRLPWPLTYVRFRLQARHRESLRAGSSRLRQGPLAPGGGSREPPTPSSPDQWIFPIADFAVLCSTSRTLESAVKFRFCAFTCS